MTVYFGRVYRITLTDPAGGQRVFDGFASAEHSPLQIEFVVDQTPNAERSIAEITVFGLNRASRQAVYEQFTEVELVAGYSQAFGVIFKGQIENVEIGRIGPDPFVKMFCQSAVDAWQTATIRRTFAPGTQQRAIIQAVAESFGLPVTLVGDFSGLPPAIKGRTLDRSSKSAMRVLSRSFGLTWFVHNGELLVFADGANVTSRQELPPTRFTPVNGLIGTPEVTQLGTNIEVLLHPFLRPRDRYTVESETAALSFNGIYYQPQEFPDTNGVGEQIVLAMTHEGSYYGDRWQTGLEGRRIGG